MCCVSVYVWEWNSRSFVAPLSITPYGGARSPAMHCLYFCRTHNNTMKMYSESFSNRWTAFTSFNWKLCSENIELHQSDGSLLRLGNDHYEYSDVFILFLSLSPRWRRNSRTGPNTHYPAPAGDLFRPCQNAREDDLFGPCDYEKII